MTKSKLTWGAAVAGVLLALTGCSTESATQAGNLGEPAVKFKGSAPSSPATSLSESTEATASSPSPSASRSESTTLSESTETTALVPSASASTTKCALKPGAMCDGADLSGMDLSGADLSGISLEGATLVGTNFSSANLSRARLKGATITGAVWKGTDLTDATTGFEARDPSLESAITCHTRIAKGAIDSRDCPCKDAGGSSVGVDPWMGGMALGAYKWMPRGYAKADGQLQSIGGNTALFSLIRNTWGGNGKSDFAMPVVTGPWAGVRTGEKGDGACLQWSVATNGMFANAPAESAYPGEIYLSAVAGGVLRNSMVEAGAQIDETIGSYLGKGFTAYAIPADWASSEPRNPHVGELRLFTTSQPLPAPFIPANGQAIDQGASPGLFDLLGNSVPVVVAPEGYQWAVASEGAYPQR